MAREKRLLMQLKRQHYDAIMSGRKSWEARPIIDKRGHASIYAKLAVAGRTVVLQSGAGTNDHVQIAEVRHYAGEGLASPVQRMVNDLGADLLPDAPDDTAKRVQEYVELYGKGFDLERVGFVAMRFERPEAEEQAKKRKQSPSVVAQAVAAQRQRLANEDNASDAVVLERRALESGLASIALAMSMPVFERRTDDLKELRAIKERRLQELRASDTKRDMMARTGACRRAAEALARELGFDAVLH